ncbi:hypothetical protein V8E53_002278 [Lactarius tabidus]
MAAAGEEATTGSELEVSGGEAGSSEGSAWTWGGGNEGIMIRRIYDWYWKEGWRSLSLQDCQLEVSYEETCSACSATGLAVTGASDWGGGRERKTRWRGERSDAHQLEHLAATPITGFLVDAVT